MILRHLANGIVCIAAALQTAASQSHTMRAVSAQASGIITGYVRDRAGLSVPGVMVTTIPERGGLDRRATTDREGAYRLEALPDDTYRVDFELLGFDLTRRNHVSVRAGVPAHVDALLTVSQICECISSGFATELPPLVGWVVDDAGRPLPHARLDLVTPRRRETTYSDRAGRFVVRPPVMGAWPLTASDSGFAPATQQISRIATAPVGLRLRFIGSQALPDTELYDFGCQCSEFLSQAGR